MAELQTHKELKGLKDLPLRRPPTGAHSPSHRRQLPPHGGGILLGQLQQHAPRALDRHAHAALVRVRVRVRVRVGLGLGLG